MTEDNKQLHIPVFYEGQDDLIYILATAMASVCYNTESFIDFYILDCGIHSFNKKQINSLKEKFDNCSITFIDVDLKQFIGLPGWGYCGVVRDINSPHYHVDCYARLLIPELVPGLNKVIYLDTDTIVLDDIKKLYDEDLERYELGAVCDLGCNDFYQTRLVNNLEVNKDQIYLNAGVLLIDAEKWRKNNVSKKLLEIAEKYKSKITVINEEILGKYYHNNNYKLLNNRYNITDRKNEIKEIIPKITDKYLENEWKNAVIQHLAPGKVWKVSRNDYNGNFLKFFDNFWFFASMTPFYDGMKLRFSEITNSILANMIRGDIGNINNTGNIPSNNTGNIPSKKLYRLFNFLPLITSKTKNNKTKYKLFGFIPLLFVKKSIK